jgi:phosphohistidine swiveling domain-containing protein
MLELRGPFAAIAAVAAHHARHAAVTAHEPHSLAGHREAHRWSAIAVSRCVATLGGLGTQRGGPLSHPATLARWFGLPAVLAMPEATQILSDGMRVELDAGTGRIL